MKKYELYKTPLSLCLVYQIYAPSMINVLSELYNVQNRTLYRQLYSEYSNAGFGFKLFEIQPARAVRLWTVCITQ